MKIYHACKDIGNVGDHLGPYIYNKLTGKVSEFPEITKEEHFFLAGSILQEATNYTTVLGAGFGARSQKLRTKPKIKIIRGPITGEMLENQGFQKTWTFGDPGLILPELYSPQISKKRILGIIPHYADYHLFPQSIDITLSVETVVDEILGCEQIISSSLHGIIIAHAYKIPCLYVKFSDNIVGDGMKYEDYFLSVGLEPYPAIDCQNGIPSRLSIPLSVGVRPPELYNQLRMYLDE